MTANPTLSPSPALFIEAPSHHFLRDRLFDENAVPFAGDQLMAPYTHLRSVLNGRGITVHTADMMPGPDHDGRKLYVSIGNTSRFTQLARRPDVVLSAFFAMECPANDPALYKDLPTAAKFFRRVFSWGDAAELEPYIGERLKLRPFFWPQSYDAVHESLWARTDRQLLVAMQGNKVPAERRGALDLDRLRAFEYFSRTNEIDLFGREWDQPPYRVGYTHIPFTFRRMERTARSVWQRFRPDPLLLAARRAWRGPASSKSRTLSHYRFAICFENMALKGWITEKIFDCFFAGTVPIYLGAPEIQQYVWPDCFIDMRQFGDHRELRSYIVSMPEIEWQRYREAARAYLASPDFTRFSKDAFADVFLDIVNEDRDEQGLLASFPGRGL